jgi:hypothetical protein
MDELQLLERINLLKSQAIMLLTEEIESLKSQSSSKAQKENLAELAKAKDLTQSSADLTR